MDLQIQDYFGKKVKLATESGVILGVFRGIDDENGEMHIQDNKKGDLKHVPLAEITDWELVRTESMKSEGLVSEIAESSEKTKFLSETTKKYQPRFIHMTTEHKNAIIKENYDRCGPKKEVAASEAAIYTVNYLIDHFLRGDLNKRTCIMIAKNDWFGQVGFYISRNLIKFGYMPDLIPAIPVNQRNVDHILYVKEERQKKKEKIQGEYDLAIVICDTTEIVYEEGFKAAKKVFIGVPEKVTNEEDKSISAVFYGPFDQRYTKFNNKLTFVESGLSRKTLIKIGVDCCPSCGYIEYQC